MRRANIKIMVLAGLLAVCWAGLRSAAANDLESIGVTRQGDSIAVTITSSTACGYNAFMTDTKPERIVVDPNRIDSTGTTSIDWYVPSHDGKFVALSLSKGGSEDGTAAIFDVESKGNPVGA